MKAEVIFECGRWIVQFKPEMRYDVTESLQPIFEARLEDEKRKLSAQWLAENPGIGALRAKVLRYEHALTEIREKTHTAIGSGIFPAGHVTCGLGLSAVQAIAPRG